MSDVKIMAVVGSLRSGSVNGAVAAAAIEAAIDGVAIELVSLNEVPLYNGDKLNEDGAVSDPGTLADIASHVASFADFCSQSA